MYVYVATIFKEEEVTNLGGMPETWDLEVGERGAE